MLELYSSDCDVYKEQTNEKFLKLFYSDPVRSLSPSIVRTEMAYFFFFFFLPKETLWICTTMGNA